uniref:Uncharacterized protein n=1 Tax=Oryza glumipatula TaxID=40148 RepID=A0A0D9YF76_9ORYZ
MRIQLRIAYSFSVPLSHDEARSLFAFVAPYVNEAKETKSSSSLPQKKGRLKNATKPSITIFNDLGGETRPLSHDEARSLFAFVAPF